MNFEVGPWLAKRRVLLGRGRGESAVLSMGRAFSAVCALGVAIASARQLGPAARGEIVLVMIVAVISTEVMCLGADVTGRIQILRGEGANVGDLLGLTVVLSVAQGAFVWLVLTVIESRAETIQPEAILPGVLLGVAVLQGHLLVAACFAVRRSLLIAGREALVGLLPLVAVFLLWRSDLLNVETVVSLVALGYLAGDLYLWVVVLRSTGPIRFSPTRWVRLVRSSFPAFVSTVAESVALRSDRILLGLSVGMTGLGVYSVAATTVEIPRLLLIPATQILANRIATGEIERRFCFSVVRRVVVVYGLIQVGVVVVATQLVVPMVGLRFSEAKTPMIVLALAEFLLGIHMAMAAVITGFGRFRSLPITAALGGLIIVVGGIVAISTGELLEVAGLKLGAFGVMAVVSSWMASRCVNQFNHLEGDSR